MHCAYLPGLAFRKRLLHGLPSGVVLGRGRQPCCVIAKWARERGTLWGRRREVCVGGGGCACACVRAWVCMRVWLWVSMEGPGPPLERSSPLPPWGLFYLQVLLGSGPWRSQCQELCQDAPRPWPPLHPLLSAFLLPITLQLLIWLLSRDVYNCKYKILKLRNF